MKRWLLGGVALMVFAGKAAAQDPTAAGPFTVLTAQYDRGDTAFVCGIAEGCTGTVPSAEIRAEVYYPSNLAAGPFPLVFFLHGNHLTCYDPTDGNISLSWPCSSGMVPIPSYRGYDYIGRILASHGYIVASISANGINAATFSSSGEGEGIPERGHLVDAHFRIWDTFNLVGSPSDGGPFASSFIGRVDLNRAGTMGHSRGGDGVVNHFVNFNGTDSPQVVRAVLPIAPTNFAGDVPANVNLGVLLGYCDGDVYTLEGSLFYDRARYTIPTDQSGKHIFTSLGSNHNYFNTVWTADCWNNQPSCWSDPRGVIPLFTQDDYPGQTIPDPSLQDPWCGTNNPANRRLSPPAQRGVGLAYVAAFFRFYIGGEQQFGPLLRGDALPPATVDPNTFVAFQPPAAQRLDLNRFNDPSEFMQTTLVGTGGVRGAVTAPGLETFSRCGFEQTSACFPGTVREIHLTNFFNLDPGLSRARLAWNLSTDSLVNQLPAGARDVSRFGLLQFRVGVDHTDPRNAMSMSPLALSVVVSDGTNSSSVNTSAQLGNNDLYFPPSESAPTAVMNTLRIPLTAFAGVNLADVRSVTLRFDQTGAGTILISDMAFAGEAPPQPRCQARESFVVGDRARVMAPGSGTPPLAIFNSGTGETRIGFDARTDGIVSVGSVRVLDRAFVNGKIDSAGAITISSTANVVGPVTPNTTVSLPALPTLPAFPAPSGPNIFVNSGETRTLAPGSFPNVTVNSGGTLRLLTAGNYFFRNLTINSAARVQVSAGTRVFVQTSFAFRNPFVTTAGAVQAIFLGYAGTADLIMEARFDGTLVAPNARVAFGIGSGLTYMGSFFARVIEVRPDSRLVCVAGPGSGQPPNACSNGVRDGAETDIDCGGPTCGDCANGRTCSVNGDCQSNRCTGGICQAAGIVSGALNVVADWGGGYCAHVLVTNTSTQPTTNWAVSINTGASTIYTSWNGNFSGNSGVINIAPGFDWNRVIPPGATNDSVGFCANRNVPGSGVLPVLLSASGTF